MTQQPPQQPEQNGRPPETWSGAASGESPVAPPGYGYGVPDAPQPPATSPALRQPRWSGKKTAVVAALAIGLSSAGAITASAAVPSGSTGGDGMGGRGGFGNFRQFGDGGTGGNSNGSAGSDGNAPGGGVPGGTMPSGAPGAGEGAPGGSSGSGSNT
ncbi:hypothetical protein [Flexivirga oryzae]|uniref:Uncharacterized protein n=1 Tax=Flexivirga oryzae TaxID=1794944 RepID=A0A839N6D7_9MICO|nr:hypothetical protein [Flexivirga oryzae]MBB2893318.1 hypothetical protein [Flexivirga oryzae]